MAYSEYYKHIMSPATKQMIRQYRRLAKARERQKHLKIKIRSEKGKHISYHTFSITKPNVPRKKIEGEFSYFKDNYYNRPVRERNRRIHMERIDTKIASPKTMYKSGQSRVKPYHYYLNYDEAPHTSLSKKDLFQLLKVEIPKRFPKAVEVIGNRGSGAHARRSRNSRQRMGLRGKTKK